MVQLNSIAINKKLTKQLVLLWYLGCFTNNKKVLCQTVGHHGTVNTTDSLYVHWYLFTWYSGYGFIVPPNGDTLLMHCVVVGTAVSYCSKTKYLVTS